MAKRKREEEENANGGAEPPKKKKKKLKKKKKKKEKELSVQEKIAQSVEGSVLNSEVRDRQLSLNIGRKWTVTLALPGSIISNCQTKELKSYVAGQIARAATIYKVDEIVIFTEDGSEPRQEFRGANRSDPNLFLARVLQYLETPQYLRKELFPLHRDLKHAGLINPLDAPHHLRWNQDCRFREGIVSEVLKDGCKVNVGWRRLVTIDKQFAQGTRVTIDFGESYEGGQVPTGRAVSPDTPRAKHGLYWGYQTRMAHGIDKVISECPFKDGYDLCVGTSERGSNAQESDFKLPKFKHLLLVFGGVDGLEVCKIQGKAFTRPDRLFDMYVNTCMNQGSGTIRTEEAILISLSVLTPAFKKAGSIA